MMKQANKKAILYFRVSTDEQADGYSLSHQEERLRSYCNLQGIAVVGTYREDHSAKTFDRPEFRKVLNFLKKNKGAADLILFTKWDRFSRNAGDAYGMINQLRKLQIEPQAIEQPLDLSVPENKMMLAFYLAAPEVENDRRALNTLVGMRRARKEGRWLGLAPKGYRNGRDERNKPMLVPDEKTAPIIRWAFEQMALGISDIDAIRRQVNEKGLAISKSQFWNLLHNTVYCGRVAVAAYKEESAHFVTGMHQPLIPEALFEQVQDVLHGRKRVRKVRSSKDEHLPLRGFIICKRCGKPVTGSAAKGNGGKYYYYHCQTAKACEERYRAETAHKAFEKMLGRISVKKSMLEIFQRQMALLFQKGAVSRDRNVKEIQAQIDKLKLRIRNAQGLMLDEEISAAEYKEIRDALTLEMDDLEAKRVAMLTSADDYSWYLSKGLPMLKRLDQFWSATEIDDAQQLTGLLFPGKLSFLQTDYQALSGNDFLPIVALPK